MIKKRFIVTGLVEVGDYVRVILYPDEPVKKKVVYNLLGMAQSGDISEMNKDAIINSIIGGNPATLYLFKTELEKEGIKLDSHIFMVLEVE
jgi:hypothetical protein